MYTLKIHNIFQDSVDIRQAISHSTREKSKSVEANRRELISFIQIHNASNKLYIINYFSHTTTRLSQECQAKGAIVPWWLIPQNPTLGRSHNEEEGTFQKVVSSYKEKVTLKQSFYLGNYLEDKINLMLSLKISNNIN